MLRKYKFFSLFLLFNTLAATSFSQAMAPLMTRTESTLKSIEKADRVIEKTVYDFIYKANESTFFYVYDFYSSSSYHITLLGDETGARNGRLRIYYTKDGAWIVLKEYTSTGLSFNVPFKPEKEGRYKVEFSCTLKDDVLRAGLGLIIDREL